MALYQPDSVFEMLGITTSEKTSLGFQLESKRGKFLLIAFSKWCRHLQKLKKISSTEINNNNLKRFTIIEFNEDCAVIKILNVGLN